MTAKISAQTKSELLQLVRKRYQEATKSESLAFWMSLLRSPSAIASTPFV